FLAIKPGVGGSNKDILDRWKIHYKGSILGSAYDENEDTGLAFRSLETAGGPVRILRQAWFDVMMGGDTPIGDPVAFLSTFYPFTAQINTSDKTLDPSYGVEVLRQTMDFDPIITGSKFYSDLNADILVDGDPTVNDNVDPTLTVPGINWYMIQGSHGTVATVVDVPLIGTHQELYYKDNSTLNDGDTGDMMAYGECGIQVSDLENPIAGTFSLATTMYYLGTNHTPAIGDSLAEQFANPLETQVTSSAYVIPVELASFNARQIKGEIDLYWTTATESKNFGFEVQRKSGDENEWQKIDFIKGAGTSSSLRSYQFVDRNVQAGTVQYRLKQIDTDGQFTLSDIAVVEVKLPTQLVLEQNYPNPFNPSTEISFQIPSRFKGSASLKVFNLLGQEVRMLLDSEIIPGYHHIRWDGRDDSGRDVISGTYIYRLQVGDKTTCQKMVKME
ncbi:MAG: T9SS type A sorting domain-containing protein, partial [Calditrichaeota bacterium]|nr:T9SS type A sorting domain-containing protein [Calditrichota bacterium]